MSVSLSALCSHLPLSKNALVIEIMKYFIVNFLPHVFSGLFYTCVQIFFKND